ncbi:hypothetical protein [Ferroplasma sp.]|uniref:hypothetical protein n=1 Tax=Ferroplasma sp. TaxID=2591003 RepID=UPI00307CD68A
MNKFITPLVAIIIFIPDIIMLYALKKIIIGDTLFYLVIIFSIEILLSKFRKTYGVPAIFFTILAILLLYLKTLSKNTTIVKKYFYYLPNMPVTYKLILTGLIIMVILLLIDGIFTQNFWHLISNYIVVSGIMLMQMATIAYMQTEGITINIFSYLSSFTAVSETEYASLLSLFTTGLGGYLPLYKLTIPLETPVSIGFMASIMGSILWLFLKDGKKNDNTFGSFSIVLGLIIGYIFFESLHFVSIQFEFLYIAIVILAVYILVSYSNKKGKDIIVELNNES